MADNRTMAQMLQAPIEGYEDAIVVPPINANNFELKQPLINLVQSNKFTELHQLDTFYNSLSTNDQDALDSAAGGNFLDKMPREGLAIIESKSKVRYSRSRPNDSRAITNAPSSTSSPFNNSFEIKQMAALLEDKMNIRMSRLEKAISEKNATTPATVKAVEEVCVTCGSNHNFNNCPLTRNDFPIFHDNIHQFQQTAAVGNFVQRNPPNLANQMNQPSVRTLEGPSTPLVPTPVVSKPQKNPNKTRRRQRKNVKSKFGEYRTCPTSGGRLNHLSWKSPKTKVKKTVNVEIQDLNSPRPNPSKLPYPERMKVRENDKPSAQHSQFLKMFKQLRLEIGLKDALVEMPKFNKWFNKNNNDEIDDFLAMEVSPELRKVYFDSERNGKCFMLNQSSLIDLLPVSPIPVEDSEPTQEEIDIFLVIDDLIPPGVENDDSEEEVNELPNLDHQDDPSIPRLPPKPPDIKKCFEPEAGILIIKEFKGVSKSHDFMTGILPTLPTLVSDLTFISSFFSFESEDTIFDPDIVTFLEPVAFSMAVSCSKYCSP
ncbi:hypothetical protein Tco_0718588 [Tanacetum coccineum]